jgi:hypothetical protein
MNCVIAFQISRNTPLTEWRSDPNLRDIISNARVIPYDNENPIPVPDCEYREAIGRINPSIVTGPQYFEFLSLLDRYRIDVNNITKFYLTYTNGFQLLENHIEQNAEDVATPLILGDN